MTNEANEYAALDAEDDARAAMIAAQAAHAALLRWNYDRAAFVPTCDDVTLAAAYAEVLRTEAVYLAILA